MFRKMLELLGGHVGRHRLMRGLSLYPPFLGAGIRVTRVSEDFGEIDVELRLTPWNANYVGTQFGGSLFAMCDPFFMLMLLERLGRDYVVWDKAASVRFRRPGRGTVRAHFHLPEARVEEIRRAADAGGKVEPLFEVQVLDGEGQVVAEVEKRLYVRRKDARAPRDGGA